MAVSKKQAEANGNGVAQAPTEQVQAPVQQPKDLNEMVAMTNRHLQVIATEKKVQLGQVDALTIVALACKGMSATIAQRKSQKVQKAKKAATPKKPTVRSSLTLSI